jgi:CheY-like chemotaxis protein
MKAVRLAAWNKADGELRRGELERMGHQVVFEPLEAGKLLRVLKEEPPLAVVIDLSRSPAQGRDLGVALRVQGSTRHLPLVFAGGSTEKVAGVRRVLPDAEFAAWDEVDAALRRALKTPPQKPVIPDSMLAGYSGTPLPKKLGIKPSSRVLLAGAPGGFRGTLGALPEGVRLMERYRAAPDLILWFVRSREELERAVDKWAARVGKGGIWIIWQKKSSGIQSGLTQAIVRRAGLDAGLVDYKIASLDETWSGLRFSVRKKGSGVS